MEAPGYWDDPEKSQEGMKELKNLKDEAEDYHALEQQYEDIETLIEMGNEENDPDLVPEVQAELEAFAAKLDSMTIKTLLSGEYDRNNAILKLNARRGRHRELRLGGHAVPHVLHAGRSATASPWRCWTIWTATRPVSSRSPSRSTVRMPTAI